jgi:hypothetical protein
MVYMIKFILFIFKKLIFFRFKKNNKNNSKLKNKIKFKNIFYYKIVNFTTNTVNKMEVELL